MLGFDGSSSGTTGVPSTIVGVGITTEFPPMLVSTPELEPPLPDNPNEGLAPLALQAKESPIMAQSESWAVVDIGMTYVPIMTQDGTSRGGPQRRWQSGATGHCARVTETPAFAARLCQIAVQAIRRHSSGARSSPLKAGVPTRSALDHAIGAGPPREVTLSQSSGTLTRCRVSGLRRNWPLPARPVRAMGWGRGRAPQPPMCRR